MHSSCEPYITWSEEWKRQKMDVKAHGMIYTSQMGHPKTKKGGKWQSESDRSKFE